LLILRVFNEYLPLKDNDAPATLPNGTFEFDVFEGASVSIQLSDIAYDEDTDSVWNATVTDEVEQTAIELIFHDKDVANEAPIGLQIMPSISPGYPNSFSFMADLVPEDSYTIYDMTISDGADEIVLPIRININEKCILHHPHTS